MVSGTKRRAKEAVLAAQIIDRSPQTRSSAHAAGASSAGRAVAVGGVDTCPGGAKIAGAGLGETTDLSGRHWKALPPVTDGFEFPRGDHCI